MTSTTERLNARQTGRTNMSNLLLSWSRGRKCSSRSDLKIVAKVILLYRCIEVVGSLTISLTQTDMDLINSIINGQT